MAALEKLAWALAVVLTVATIVLVHAINNRAAPKPSIVTLTDTVAVHDTVFRTDTARAKAARQRYEAVAQPIRLGLEGKGDNRKVLDVVVTAADTALATDSTTIQNCARLVEAQRRLISALVPPPPRLQYFIEPMYSLTDGSFAVNGGAELRLFGSWSAVANAIVSKQSGVFVGLSKSF